MSVDGYLKHDYIAPVTPEGAELASPFMHLLAMMLLGDDAMCHVFLETSHECTVLCCSRRSQPHGSKMDHRCLLGFLVAWLLGCLVAWVLVPSIVFLFPARVAHQC